MEHDFIFSRCRNCGLEDHYIEENNIPCTQDEDEEDEEEVIL